MHLARVNQSSLHAARYRPGLQHWKRFLVRLAIGVSLLFVSAALAQTGTDPRDTIEREIKTGTILLQQGHYEEARTHFEHAQTLQGKATAETSAGLCLTELQMGHFEASRQMAKVELELVTNNHARAQAHYMIGTAWLREAGDSSSDKIKLQSAESSFREAVKLDPTYDQAFFNLGYALLRQNKDEESSSAFRDFVNAAGENRESAKGLQLSPKSRLAPFSIEDETGRIFSSDSLRGRFVLFDFWATWCPPCIRAFPAMRQLARFFPENQFLLISVDEDVNNKEEWRRFRRMHELDWTQVWDQHSDLYHAFGLAANSRLSLPRYVLVDTDGYIRQVYSGTDQLGFLVGQVVRMVRTAQAENGSHK